jgi:hypothetical protein
VLIWNVKIVFITPLKAKHGYIVPMVLGMVEKEYLVARPVALEHQLKELLSIAATTKRYRHERNKI